jgi:hypothetical protein
MKTQTNKQFLDFLKYSVRLGERILKDDEQKDALFQEYLERMEELIEYLNNNRNGMNLLVSWKVNGLEVYRAEKDYSPRWNKVANRIFFFSAKNKAAPDNVTAYIQKQNLLMSAIEFYYRYQG